MQTLHRAAGRRADCSWPSVKPSFADEPDAFHTTDFYLRLPVRSTDRAYIGAHSKDTSQAIAPEAYFSYHFEDRNWEARVDARLARRRANVSGTDRDQFFGEVEFGPRFGATSLVLDWQPTQYDDNHIDKKVLEFEEIGLKLKGVTTLGFLDHDVVSYFLETSTVNAHPTGLRSQAPYGEAAWTVPKGLHTRVTWTIEAGAARYDNFFGKRRFDTTMGLRRVVRREFGSGLSLGLSVYGAAAASTHSQKSGFEFELRPDVRFRWN